MKQVLLNICEHLCRSSGFPGHCCLVVKNSTLELLLSLLYCHYATASAKKLQNFDCLGP